jgi:hypothetical protein
VAGVERADVRAPAVALLEILLGERAVLVVLVQVIVLGEAEVHFCLVPHVTETHEWRDYTLDRR